MNHAGIRSALSRIAWAYLLIHLHFRLNNLDLLPDWAGYLLIFSAIGLLAGELRDLPLLRPFCILLGAVSGVDWLARGAEMLYHLLLTAPMDVMEVPLWSPAWLGWTWGVGLLWTLGAAAAGLALFARRDIR